MKRPLIGFTFMWAAGIYFQLNGFNFPEIIYKPWFITLIFIIIIVLRTIKRYYSAVASILLAGLFCGILFSNTYEKILVNPISDLSKKVHNVSATVLDYPEKFEDCIRVKIKVPKSQLNDSKILQDVTTLIYLNDKKRPLLPGDQIELEIAWYIPTVKDGFNRFRYFKSEGIYILGSLKKDTDYTINQTKSHPWWYYPKYISYEMKKSSKNVLNSRQSGFLNAVLLGDTSELNDLDASHMRKSGVSHVTSVSGLHISFLISFLILFLGKKYGSVISICAIIIFILMVGWSPSVLRAGFMYIIFVLSYLINRENDSLTALFAALLFILITNPFTIFGVGLQLSYASTIGIILFSTKIQQKFLNPFKKCAKFAKISLKFIMSSFSCSFSAMIFTIPILMYSFGYISILSPLANILILWAVSIIFVFGLIMVVIYPFAPIIARILSIPIGYLIDFILFITTKIADVSFGVVYSDNKLALYTIFVFYVAVILMYIFPRIFKMRYCIPVLSVIIVVVTWYGLEEKKTDSIITFLPSGYGQTITVSAGKEVALIDCSSSTPGNSAKSVSEWMDWWGYNRINLLILTSVDKTHARNLPELIKTVPIEKIIIPPNCRQNDFYKEVLDAIKKSNIPVEVYSKLGENKIVNKNFGISLIGGIERKLAVRVKNNENDILILHSLTQKMQNKLLTTQTLKAQTVVFSQSSMGDMNTLTKTLSALEPKNIIVESNYIFTSKLFGIPVLNTFESGQIKLKSKMITYKEQ